MKIDEIIFGENLMNVKALIPNPKGHQHLKIRVSRGASKGN